MTHPNDPQSPGDRFQESPIPQEPSREGDGGTVSAGGTPPEGSAPEPTPVHTPASGQPATGQPAPAAQPPRSTAADPQPEKPKRSKDETRHPASRRLPLIFAFVVIVVGLWLLAEAMGYAVPRFSRIWPIFITVGGLASLLDYLLISKRPRSAGQAVFGLGLSAVCFLFSLGYAGWNEVLDWLPVAVLCAGAGMLTTYVVAGRKGRDAGLFALSLVVLLLGVFGLFVRLDFLRDLLPSVQMLWAVGLLIVGGAVAWRVFRKG